MPETQRSGLCAGAVDYALLAKHIRKHCVRGDTRSCKPWERGTVSKILSAHPVKPHKIQYYLERRDPEFKAKMIEVLHVYREVELLGARRACLPKWWAC